MYIEHNYIIISFLDVAFFVHTMRVKMTRTRKSNIESLEIEQNAKRAMVSNNNIKSAVYNKTARQQQKSQ